MVNNQNEMIRTKKIPDLFMFLALWDDFYGPRIIDFYPNSTIGNIEDLSVRIFNFYQFFGEEPNLAYQRTYYTIPITKINRKARVLFDSLVNPDIRGGKQPFIIVLLFPSFLSEKQMDLSNETLLKTSQNFMRNDSESFSIKSYYQEISLSFRSLFSKSKSSLALDEHYSYSVALDDFKAGIKLFQTQNYGEALSILQKVLLKFEKEEHKHLVMEVLYMIASILAQKKDFISAQKQFKRLRVLANELNHEKFLEISVFMEAFCAYKNENYTDAKRNFEKIDISKSKHLNKLQYYTIYGRILEHFEKNEDALKYLIKALDISNKFDDDASSRFQQAELLYLIGAINYKIAFNKFKDWGILKREEALTHLDDALTFFKRSVDVLEDTKDEEKLIVMYQLIGNVHEIMHADTLALDYYRRAMKIANENKFKDKFLRNLRRTVQMQMEMKMFEENIEFLANFFKNEEMYRFVDIFTIIHLHHQLAECYMVVGDTEQALVELNKAHGLIKNSKINHSEVIDILKKIIKIYSLSSIHKKEIRAYEEELEKEKNKGSKDLKFIQNRHQPLYPIKEIWMYSISTGVGLYNYTPESNIDNDLLGGFLIAIQQFSMELSQKEVQDMVVGDDRYVIYQNKEYDFYILGRANSKIPLETCKELLSIIYRRFWKEYHQYIKNFQGNITPFQKFTQIIESLDLSLMI
ncbi:MAG: hypothetical protein EU539_08895 [Promethearchaeota archaeon]|nr:MAG: hypothetical protein EU539_08895 [Candidatus Lokiarchaeota archaeon]